ncbi:MAG: cysteine--tRNA ligase [Candidatus Paceibacterota bacterium]
MDIKIHNTLTKKVEVFEPVKPGFVYMYHCGPTVYNYAHIGNLRAYVFADTIRRVFEINKYQVKQVMNITDVGHLTSDSDEGEDKMTLALKREGKPLTLEAMKEVADFYAEAFAKDTKKLNIEIPDIISKASEHISDNIELIKRLEEKGFAYKTSDGVYFDTFKFEGYGKLGNINIEKLKEGARVVANPEKKHHTDFAVWKFNEKLGWDSPWGKGFPGWHIECSSMSMKYLGETFDIHTGGIDHIPVHHNNEIAQSEAATGKPFVHYWIHANFITVEGQRFAKSLHNEFYIKDLEEKGLNPLAYRYWLLTSHYSTPANFTWEAVEGAQKAFDKLLNTYSSLGDTAGTADKNYSEKFLEHINNDFDTPQAIALLWELIKDDNISPADKKATLDYFDLALGLNIKVEAEKKAASVEEIPEEIKKLAEEREEARKNKDWSKADSLREEIKNLGYEVEDNSSGEDLKIKKI